MNIGKDHISHALIVDDEADICYLLGGILRQKHIQTSFANTLADASQKLQKEHPAILFLDNNLPDGKGVEFISLVKTLSPGTKVVMITAYDTHTDRSRAYHEGADFFIGKPFTRELITNTLEQLGQSVTMPRQ